MKDFNTQTKHYFFDTSALVKRFHKEKGSEKVDELYENLDNQIIISEMTLVEMPAALNKKRIEGKMDKERLNMLLYEFFSDVARRYVVLSYDEKILLGAINLVLEKGLRTLDSFQLSFCLDFKENIGQEVCFISADKDLLNIAKQKGLITINPEEYE